MKKSKSGVLLSNAPCAISFMRLKADTQQKKKEVYGVGKQMVVLTCPDCGGHDDAVVDNESGEVHFACPYCHYVGFYLEVPKDNFGKILLCWSTGRNDISDYVLMTVRLQESRVKYFVLSNTDVVHEGDSMSAAAKAYHEVVSRL